MASHLQRVKSKLFDLRAPQGPRHARRASTVRSSTAAAWTSMTSAPTCPATRSATSTGRQPPGTGPRWSGATLRHGGRPCCWSPIPAATWPPSPGTASRRRTSPCSPWAWWATSRTATATPSGWCAATPAEHGAAGQGRRSAPGTAAPRSPRHHLAGLRAEPARNPAGLCGPELLPADAAPGGGRRTPAGCGDGTAAPPAARPARDPVADGPGRRAARRPARAPTPTPTTSPARRRDRGRAVQRDRWPGCCPAGWPDPPPSPGRTRGRGTSGTRRGSRCCAGWALPKPRPAAATT